MAHYTYRVTALDAKYLRFRATTLTYRYHPNGQPTQVTQAGGVNRTVRYAYDSLGRLRVKDTPLQRGARARPSNPNCSAPLVVASRRYASAVRSISLPPSRGCSSINTL
jgi:YD repeat-containing protein